MSGPVVDAAAYDWLTLDEGETVEWTGQPHEYSLVPALVIGVPLAIILIGVVIIVWAYLARENTDYVITDEALYVKRGVVSRDVQRIGYEKVQNTSYSQDFFGTQFGYGHVEISTAGGSGVEMRFRSVPEPKAVQERVNRHIRGSGADRTERQGEAAVLDEILAELRAIRSAVEAGSDAGGRDDAGRNAGVGPATTSDRSGSDRSGSDDAGSGSGTGGAAGRFDPADEEP